MNKVEECVDGVITFNNIGGNLENIDYPKLRAQAAVVYEEGKEYYDAVFLKQGPEQTLKEIIDVLVTAHGAAAQLEALGYDVCGAWQVVNDNNLTKFCDKVTAEYSKHYYDEAGTPVSIQCHCPSNSWIIRDKNGKIRKPINYKPVDLKEFLPKVIQQGGV